MLKALATLFALAGVLSPYLLSGVSAVTAAQQGSHGILNNYLGDGRLSSSDDDSELLLARRLSSSPTTTAATTALATHSSGECKLLRPRKLRGSAHRQPDGSTPTTKQQSLVLVHRGGSTTVTSQPSSASIMTAARTTSLSAIAHTAQVLSYFALWYILNIWYNIVNKKVLNAVGMPVSVAVAQLGIGSLWVGLQWAVGLRRRPGSLAGTGLARVAPVALFHGGGQLATVLSLGAGAVSFTHVVKAMEPFFSALVAAVCFGQVFRPQVYASLMPVVSGVSLACLKGTVIACTIWVCCVCSSAWWVRDSWLYALTRFCAACIYRSRDCGGFASGE